MRLAAPTPHQNASDNCTQQDTPGCDWPECWLDDTQQAGGDADHSDRALHWPEAAGSDPDVHSRCSYLGPENTALSGGRAIQPPTRDRPLQRVVLRPLTACV